MREEKGFVASRETARDRTFISLGLGGTVVSCGLKYGIYALHIIQTSTLEGLRRAYTVYPPKNLVMYNCCPYHCP